MNVAICDDFLSDASELSNILQSSPAVDKLKIYLYDDGKKLLSESAENTQFDLVFLDIDMPTMNGIELAKELKAVHPQMIVIFATAHPQYMLDAFDLEAFHYILKPFNPQNVLSVFQKAYQKYLSLIRYHCIKIKSQTIRLNMDDIYYVECCQKHVVYHTADKDYEVIETFGSVCDALRDFGFCRIHQGYIVNMDKIDHFKGYSVVLIDGRPVPISVRKKAEVIAAYTKYIRG